MTDKEKKNNEIKVTEFNRPKLTENERAALQAFKNVKERKIKNGEG